MCENAQLCALFAISRGYVRTQYYTIIVHNRAHALHYPLILSGDTYKEP